MNQCYKPQKNNLNRQIQEIKNKFRDYKSNYNTKNNELIYKSLKIQIYNKRSQQKHKYSKSNFKE